MHDSLSIERACFRIEDNNKQTKRNEKSLRRSVTQFSYFHRSKAEGIFEATEIVAFSLSFKTKPCDVDKRSTQTPSSSLSATHFPY